MDYFLDITKETCPMTFVKVKLQLSKMEKDDQLEVKLNEGEPLDNLPRSAKDQGFTVLSVEPFENQVYKVVIKK